MQGYTQKSSSVCLTCRQVEGQSKVLGGGVGEKVFSSHQDSQQLHAHARAPDGEEIPCVIGLWTHTIGCSVSEMNINSEFFIYE